VKAHPSSPSWLGGLHGGHPGSLRKHKGGNATARGNTHLRANIEPNLNAERHTVRRLTAGRSNTFGKAAGPRQDYSSPPFFRETDHTKSPVKHCPLQGPLVACARIPIRASASTIATDMQNNAAGLVPSAIRDIEP